MRVALLLRLAWSRKKASRCSLVMAGSRGNSHVEYRPRFDRRCADDEIWAAVCAYLIVHGCGSCLQFPETCHTYPDAAKKSLVTCASDCQWVSLGGWHFECYHAIACIGAVLHTLNLSPVAEAWS